MLLFLILYVCLYVCVRVMQHKEMFAIVCMELTVLDSIIYCYKQAADDESGPITSNGSIESITDCHHSPNPSLQSWLVLLNTKAIYSRNVKLKRNGD